MSAHRRVVRGVFESREFNALLWRLPRGVRRSIQHAPPGEVGLIVEIVSADDCTLMTVCAQVPCTIDVPGELDRLEARAHRQLAERVSAR